MLTSSDLKTMTLVYPKGAAEEGNEEMVLRLQGYVLQSHLPPILSRKQYVRTTSLSRMSQLTLRPIGWGLTQPWHVNHSLLRVSAPKVLAKGSLP